MRMLLGTRIDFHLFPVGGRKYRFWNIIVGHEQYFKFITADEAAQLAAWAMHTSNGSAMQFRGHQTASRLLYLDMNDPPSIHGMHMDRQVRSATLVASRRRDF